MDNPISCYDPNRFDREAPANVRGGLSRSKQARRDSFGRFQPIVGCLPLTNEHGVSGGRKRAATGKRDDKGRYTK